MFQGNLENELYETLHENLREILPPVFEIFKIFFKPFPISKDPNPNLKSYEIWALKTQVLYHLLPHLALSWIPS